MYNLCKTIRIGRYAFTFDFYIHKEALIVEWLFESINPTRRISIEFNTSSFLLSYLDRLIGIEVDDIYLLINIKIPTNFPQFFSDESQ